LPVPFFSAHVARAATTGLLSALRLRPNRGDRLRLLVLLAGCETPHRSKGLHGARRLRLARCLLLQQQPIRIH
jgi:hypothetical protein